MSLVGIGAHAAPPPSTAGSAGGHSPAPRGRDSAAPPPSAAASAGGHSPAPRGRDSPSTVSSQSANTTLWWWMRRPEARSISWKRTSWRRVAGSRRTGMLTSPNVIVPAHIAFGMYLASQTAVRRHVIGLGPEEQYWVARRLDPVDQPHRVEHLLLAATVLVIDHRRQVQPPRDDPLAIRRPRDRRVVHVVAPAGHHHLEREGSRAGRKALGHLPAQVVAALRLRLLAVDRLLS